MESVSVEPVATTFLLGHNIYVKAMIPLMWTHLLLSPVLLGLFYALLFKRKGGRIHAAVGKAIALLILIHHTSAYLHALSVRAIFGFTQEPPHNFSLDTSILFMWLAPCVFFSLYVAWQGPRGRIPHWRTCIGINALLLLGGIVELLVLPSRIVMRPYVILIVLQLGGTFLVLAENMRHLRRTRESAEIPLSVHVMNATYVFIIFHFTLFGNVVLFVQNHTADFPKQPVMLALFIYGVLGASVLAARLLLKYRTSSHI